jgi:hypothetical protein
MKNKREELQDEAIQALKNTRFSNYRIAKGTGIAESSIGNYKNGKTKPTPVNSRILIDFLKKKNAQKGDEQQNDERILELSAQNSALEKELGFLRESLQMKEKQIEALIKSNENVTALLNRQVLSSERGKVGRKGAPSVF